MRTVLKTIIRFIHLDPEGINGRLVRHLPPLFLLAVSLLPVGCALVDEDSAGSPATHSTVSGDAVAFSVSVPGITRTAEGTEDLSSLQSGSGFGVFAAHHGIHPYASSNILCDFMWNQQVTYDGSLGGGLWTYSPIKYWPNGDGTEENREYLTFFAYAPYAEASADGCITDFSKSGEVGDPWLVYQLGGTRDDWQSSQVDLLYAFTKDQQKGKDVSDKVAFDFRHALACAGDKVTLDVSSVLKTRLKAAALHAGEDVRLILNKVTLNYSLLRKGRLIMNGNEKPNWQSVESEDPLVHRVCKFVSESGVEMARATSDGTWIDINNSLSDLDDSYENNGIFYIPLDLKDKPQTLDIAAEYSVKTGSLISYSGAVGCTITLSASAEPGRTQDIRLVFSDDLTIEGSAELSVMLRILDIADQTYTGSPITPSAIIVNAEGRILSPGTDYTLAYTDNTDAGTATVIVTGVGDYQGGLATKTFVIQQATGVINIEKTSLTVGESVRISCTGGGKLTLTSSAPDVATATVDPVDNSSGQIKAVRAGSCIVTATVEDSSNYTYPVKTVTYLVNVQ